MKLLEHNTHNDIIFELKYTWIRLVTFSISRLIKLLLITHKSICLDYISINSTESNIHSLCSGKLLGWYFSSNFSLEVRILSFSLYQRSQYLADWDVKIIIATIFFAYFFYHCESLFWVLMIALMIILVTEFRLCPAQMFLSEQCHDGTRDGEVCSCRLCPTPVWFQLLSAVLLPTCKQGADYSENFYCV